MRYQIALGILSAPLIGLAILLEWICKALMRRMRHGQHYEPTICGTPFVGKRLTQQPMKKARLR